MGIEEFGRALLETQDLDPIYTMLHRAKLEREQLKRWCMAYWFFYHAGVASKLSEYEGPDFFGACLYRVDEKSTPRGTERRHFRGEKAERALLWFGSTYQSAEAAVDSLWEQKTAPSQTRTFQDVSDRVREWPQFGPWIAFKVADMLERVLDIPVDFSGVDLLSFYEEPRKAAEILASRFAQNCTAEMALSYCLNTFKDNPAPPSSNRSCGIQEVETILCKWKSHLNGHYPVGKDTREIHHALNNWGPLAKRLQECLPSAANV